MRKNSQAAQKGPAARRRPRAAREAYSLYVERAAEGANEADGPLSSLYTRRGIWQAITPLITAAATSSSLPGAGLVWSPSSLGRLAPGPRRRLHRRSRSAWSGTGAWVKT